MLGSLLWGALGNMLLRLKGNLWPPMLSLEFRTSTLSVPSLKSATLLWKPRPGLCPEGPNNWKQMTQSMAAPDVEEQARSAVARENRQLKTGNTGLFPATGEQPFGVT